MKKIVSICLALSMILSLSLCAFADYEPGVEPAEIEEVAIDVSLEDAISGVSRSLSDLRNLGIEPGEITREA